MLTTTTTIDNNGITARAALEFMRLFCQNQQEVQFLIQEIFSQLERGGRRHHPENESNTEQQRVEESVVEAKIIDEMVAPLLNPSFLFSPSASSNSSSSPPSSSPTAAEGYPIHCQWFNCFRSLSDHDTLIEHVRLDHLTPIHLGQANVVCQWRDCHRDKKPFSAIYMLTQHLRAHTGERPYSCDWPNCAKRYSRLENLKTHQRKHTGERPYACRLCAAAFTNASDKGKHVDRVHGEKVDGGDCSIPTSNPPPPFLLKKRYECLVDACPNSYTDPSSLRKHIFNSHGKMEWHQYKNKRRIKDKNDDNGQQQQQDMPLNHHQQQQKVA